ncbi:MAG: 2-isopropylmalate synthase [Armatimonadetes bacterium CG_4_9_14_3_um_filter_58_7]|nr:MAG: 2-isopropylmalate synthase [Armatimonadetes bacterium CG_4_9_14_3_um_filter_58_7]
MRIYQLQHVDEPNLVEDVFPHVLPPLIAFEGVIHEYIDGEYVEIDPRDVKTRDIYVTDTTFRDGQQARPPYKKEQMVRLFQMLSELGGPNGIVRQSEFFLYTKNDRDAIEACQALGLRYPEITGWIRANKMDFRLVREMGLSETGMLTSSSDYHIFYKQNQTRQEAMDQYLEVVEAALEHGIRPRCHLEDITRADLPGFVYPFVQRLEKLTEDQPDNMKIKIRLCDTMGFGLPFPNVPEPRSIPKLIWRLKNECGVTADRLEWHGHNDFHKVHVNGAFSWIYGLNALNATLFGFGERTGNPPLEGAIIEYVSLKGELNGVNLRVITEMADYYQKEIGTELSPNYPFVGRDFNTTRAGIHAGGMRRNERIYNIFDTEALLGHSPRVAITDKSGTDGIALWVNEFLGLEDDDRLSVMKVVKIQRWVMDQYEKEHRLTTISDQELEEQVKIHLPEYYEKMKKKVTSGK